MRRWLAVLVLVLLGVTVTVRLGRPHRAPVNSMGAVADGVLPPHEPPTPQTGFAGMLHS